MKHESKSQINDIITILVYEIILFGVLSTKAKILIKSQWSTVVKCLLPNKIRFKFYVHLLNRFQNLMTSINVFSLNKIGTLVSPFNIFFIAYGMWNI